MHRVKAHDVRALAASTAFQAEVSLDQLLSACHWKSHNTFIQFYLEDVAWADAELYHLGPVVAAQQIHHPSKCLSEYHLRSFLFYAFTPSSDLSLAGLFLRKGERGGGGG